jgi:hypothetical protein
VSRQPECIRPTGSDLSPHAERVLSLSLVEGQRPLSSPFSFLLCRHLRMTSRANKKITTTRAIHTRILYISRPQVCVPVSLPVQNPQALQHDRRAALRLADHQVVGPLLERRRVASRSPRPDHRGVKQRDTARIGHNVPADAPVGPGEQKTAGDRRRRGRREARGARRTAGTARVRLLCSGRPPRSPSSSSPGARRQTSGRQSRTPSDGRIRRGRCRSSEGSTI